MELVWTLGSNSNSIYDVLNALHMICPKLQLYVVLTCMKMVQMDRLDFSDHFSYIICLISSYGWIYMNFWSLYYFLEFLIIFWFILIPEKALLRQHYVKVMSAGQLDGSWSNLTSGVHWSVTQCCLGSMTGGSGQWPRQQSQPDMWAQWISLS